MHSEQVTLVKILAVAIAIGLDVFAISVGVGITKAEWSTRIRLGAAFATAEITMQVIGYELGTGAGSSSARSRNGSALYCSRWWAHS